MSRFLAFLLSFVTLFVPRSTYERKVENTPAMDEKFAEWDAREWEYKKISRPDNKFTHRYFECPSAADTAPVFLFFHGLVLDGRTFVNLGPLAEHWRLISYNLPESTSRYSGSMKDFMDITYEFIELMDITSCCVCGVSFGGGIALRLASDGIIDVRHLILISTGIVGSTERERKQQHTMAEWARSIPDYKLYWFMERVYNATRREYRDDTTGLQEFLRVKHVDFFRQVATAMDRYDVSVHAQKVSCP
ncbi:MAG: hypothetical protein GF350_06145, partial [Chitinivibrionales bacterium]|nr:hypothetical protein [Chitinivibrionales bacterium]